MSKKSILLQQHKFIWFFNLKNSKYQWQSVHTGYPACKQLYGILLLLTFSHFLMMVETQIQRFFSLFIFNKIRDIPNTNICTVNPWKKIVKVDPSWLGSERNLISRIFKTPVSSLCKSSFCKRINIERKNTRSESLISFRKIQPVSYFYNPAETLIIQS